MQDTEQARLL